MFARTPRLLLRPGWMEDAPALTGAIGDSAVLRNLMRVPSPYRESDAMAYLAQSAQQTMPNFLAFSRTHGAPRLVGGCGLMRAENGMREIGYWIARPYWGLGFATEAARAVMAIARATGERNIIARHFVDNPASGNVLRKIGFHTTGRIERRYSAARAAHADCLVYEQGEEGHMCNDLMGDIYSDMTQDGIQPIAA